MKKRKLIAVLTVWTLISIVVYMFLCVYLTTFRKLLRSCDISEEKNNKLRTLVKTVSTVFEEHNVTYWVDYGTALGAYRHCDVIPWDHDADISYLYSDHDKLIKAAADISKIEDYDFDADLMRILFLQVQVDLFPWEKVKQWWTLSSIYSFFTGTESSANNYVMYQVNRPTKFAIETFIKNFFSDYFPYHFISKRSRVKFGDFEVYTVRNVTELIQWRYTWSYNKVFPHSVFCTGNFHNTSC